MSRTINKQNHRKAPSNHRIILDPGIAADDLWRLSEGAQKRTPHALPVRKAGFPGHDVDGKEPVFHQEARLFEPQMFDGLGVLVARNRERLEAVAKRLTDKHHVTVTTMIADLADAADLLRIEQVVRADERIAMLVNNAGLGAAAPLLQANVDKMQEMIAVNVTALTRLTYAAVPGFVARRKGTIVNIASVVAVQPEILNGVYGATKAFVLALSQSLLKEVGDKGVRVQVVLPGATATEFWDVAGYPVSNLPASWVMSADDMVDAALAGLDAGEFATIPALPDAADWAVYETARQAMFPNLSHAKPAARYLARA